MTLLELQNQYHKELIEIYPKSEITSIFRLLVKDKLNLDSAEIVLEVDKELSIVEIDHFFNVLKRLNNKEPVQYIVGNTSFFNLPFKVNSNVLIPRPETEELVQWIITDTQTNPTNHKVQILDIGTGSGCIAISLAKNIKNAEIWALDISKLALEIAKYNAKQNDVTINFLNSDILKVKKLPQFFDIIVSNPPYVKQQEKKAMHGNVLLHEPNQALFVTDDNPLLFYKKIANLASNHLTQSGKLYFEINQYLGNETLKLIKANGFINVILKKDFLENNRMIRAEKN
jgi:release factor glutamine methyltransferase